MTRHRLTSKQREELYDREAKKALAAGLGELPICNICTLPVDGARDRWHDSHNPYLPHALGGERDGIAHERCNLRHNNKHDTPLVAKNKRVRQNHIGATAPSLRPLPGGRNDWLKKKIDGTVVNRRTGESLFSRVRSPQNFGGRR